MIIKIAGGRISKKTMNDLNEHLKAFSSQPYLAFWVGDQAYLDLTSRRPLICSRHSFARSNCASSRKRMIRPIRNDCAAQRGKGTGGFLGWWTRATIIP